MSLIVSGDEASHLHSHFHRFQGRSIYVGWVSKLNWLLFEALEVHYKLRVCSQSTHQFLEHLIFLAWVWTMNFNASKDAVRHLLIYFNQVPKRLTDAALVSYESYLTLAKTLKIIIFVVRFHCLHPFYPPVLTHSSCHCHFSCQQICSLWKFVGVWLILKRFQ